MNWVITFCVLIVSAAITTTNAHAQGSDRIARIVHAYGGAAALNRVVQVETDWAGYFIARHQSRHTDPPYDRLPRRTWSAIDLTTDRSVSDSISVYAGELNLGLRVINNGANSFSLNTISKIYAKGGMFSHEAIVQTAENRMPWMLVRKMISKPGEFVAAGTREYQGFTYDIIRHGMSDLWVHPETSLIHAISRQAEDMVDVEIDIFHTFTNYFQHDGVMFNRRYQSWANGEATSDLELYSVRFNRPLTDHLRLPAHFIEVPTLDGYNGVGEIGVERIGAGVFLAGSGDTRVLYVEFDDHFVAMEAGGMPDYTEQTYNAMRPYMRNKPLRYIIPTHHHDDHAVAIHFYARIGATIMTTRDKEEIMRRLLSRAWGDAQPVKNAKFRFIDGPRLVLEDRTNRLTVHVYRDAPHTENMLVGYLNREGALYTCDVFIGWIGSVRQGASYGGRHLARWIAARQASGSLGPVRNYTSCHGRPYSPAEFQQMLSMERTIVTLPSNDPWPTSNWFDRYGLTDDTARNPRRDQVFDPIALR